MNNQEAFNIAAVHLIRQGRRAVDPGMTYPDTPNGLCRYRAPNGDKCSIGALIPDDRYTPDLECHLGPYLAKALPDVFAGVETALLTRLQMVHDQGSPPAWRPALLRVAADLRLSTAALDAEPLGPAETA